MDLRAVDSCRARPARHASYGTTRNARRSLREWARAQGAVTVPAVRVPPPAAASPGPAAAPSLTATAHGH